MWRWWVTWGLIVFVYLAARFEAYYILWRRTQSEIARLEEQLAELSKLKRKDDD